MTYSRCMRTFDVPPHRACVMPGGVGAQRVVRSWVFQQAVARIPRSRFLRMRKSARKSAVPVSTSTLAQSLLRGAVTESLAAMAAKRLEPLNPSGSL